MSTVNFRKIDVDALDPDNPALKEQDLIPKSIPQISQSQIDNKIEELRRFISKGDGQGALFEALNNPNLIYGSKIYSNPEISNNLIITIIQVLTSIRQSDIPKIINNLKSNQQDLLVKLLYKGMSIPESHSGSGVLLAWFDKTVEISGQGSIVRAISDRRTV